MKHNPIRIAALIIVAIIGTYVMWLAWVVNNTLSGPGWCRTALGAEKASSTDGTIKGLDACVGLLTIQLKSLATNSHILLGTVAMCLLVLVVIVVAGARLDAEIPGGGKIGMREQGDPVPVEVTNPPTAPVPTAPVGDPTAPPPPGATP